MSVNVKRTPKKSDVLVYGEEFARKALAMPNSFRVCAFAFASDGKEFGTFMRGKGIDIEGCLIQSMERNEDLYIFMREAVKWYEKNIIDKSE